MLLGHLHQTLDTAPGTALLRWAGPRTKDDEHLTSGLPKLDNSVEVCIVSELIVAGGNFQAARRGLVRTKADLERLEPYQTSFE